MKFIDFHNHILPNCDDGSKSVDISLDMLREAQRQGITDVVNTIHYQHPKPRLVHSLFFQIHPH